MSIHEYRARYFHITKSQLQHHKQIDSLELQTAVELWLAKNSKNKIERIPMGVSGYKHIGSRYLRRIEGDRL